MDKQVSVKFIHGLGDCADFAHLIPLYTRRGYEVHVRCEPSKATLFLAAGASLVGQAVDTHDWLPPPEPPPANHFNHWSGSKPLWNISQPPMPDIGHYSQHWTEYSSVRLSLDAFVASEVRQDVDRYLAGLPRPIVCIHTMGNTDQHLKNLDPQATRSLYHELLSNTDASLILLDWDNRVPRLPSYRVRHLLDDWKRLSTLELYYLQTQADLFIGVDSGPLHLLRFTDTLGLGIWMNHFPSHFTLPREQSLNVVASRWHEWAKFRRVPFRIVECCGEYPSGSFLAQQAIRLLDQRRFLSSPVADTQLQHWLDHCGCLIREGRQPSHYVDRHRSFGLALEFLRTRSDPTVVETGCIRAEDDWTAGFATYLLGAFLHHNGGKLHSVELDPRNVEFARAWTANFNGVVEIHQAHSHQWLETFQGAIDLFYADSADVGTPDFEECCLREVELALSKLKIGGQILIDDTVYTRGRWIGKGALAVPMLLEKGCQLIYSGYQCLLGT